jgi:hypothetical protein
MHRRVAVACAGSRTMLELGAGTLNHLRYVPEGALYDIVEPNDWLYDGAAERPRIRRAYRQLEEASAGGGSYDRVLSIATLEHIGDLPACLARSALLLSGDGRFVAGIPSEGGFLWWLGWRATTGLSYRLRHGLDYGVLMRHEHLNRAEEIEALVRHFFAAVRRRRFPLPWLNGSLYTFLDAAEPRRERCRDYLDALVPAPATPLA